MIEHCPESTDYGYWYVVLATQPYEPIGEQAKQPAEDPTADWAKTPACIIPGQGWCAWYGVVNGIEYAAVRTPDPVVGIETQDVPVADVLVAAGYKGKPYGRIWGR